MVYYLHCDAKLLHHLTKVEKIKKMDGYDGTIFAPLMSNLAISKQYRRRGLAEELVKATELIARKEWGYNECYLYVEKRNVPAIKLYTKLGYKPIWEDDNATTLVPSVDGRGVVNGKTTIVCMKKKLGGGIFG
jgi:GNAT superfamily N-acetyltransferase